MRIGFVTPWDVTDVYAWSGMVKQMFTALDRRVDVVVIPTGDLGDHLIDRAAARLLDGRFDRRYLPGHSVATSLKQSKVVRSRVRSAGVDVALGVVASQLLAWGRAPVPTVQVGDTTWRSIRDYYPLFSRLNPLSAWQGALQARQTASATDAFVMSSQWAADSLQHDYGVESSVVTVAPLGPSSAGGSGPVRDGIPSDRPMRLLFVGSDWTRKGGDRALQIYEQLRRRRSVELTVVGAAPSTHPGVAFIGRLPLEAMSAVYASHDVLLEPARANAGGVTLTDAASHGMPVVATSTGGVPSIVADEVSGLLVEPSRVVTDSVAALNRLGDTSIYAELSAGAARRYRNLLNWDAWAASVTSACERVVADRLGCREG